MRIAQSGFAQFMATPAGRLARILAGLALEALGIWGLQGTARVVIVVIGLVPLLAGLFDVCAAWRPVRGESHSGGSVVGAGLRVRLRGVRDPV